MSFFRIYRASFFLLISAAILGVLIAMVIPATPAKTSALSWNTWAAGVKANSDAQDKAIADLLKRLAVLETTPTPPPPTTQPSTQPAGPLILTLGDNFYTVSQGSIGTGSFTQAAVFNPEVASLGPSITAGMLDMEMGWFETQAMMTATGSEAIKAIAAARSIKPAIKWGWYDVPHNGWPLAPGVVAAIDFAAPSEYQASIIADPAGAEARTRTAMALLPGKPTFAVISHRVRGALALVPDDQFTAHIKAVMHAAPAGVIWFNADTFGNQATIIASGEVPAGISFEKWAAGVKDHYAALLSNAILNPTTPETVPALPVAPVITPSNQTPSGPLDVGPGDVAISNKSIQASLPWIIPGSANMAGGQGISCSGVGTLTLANDTVKSYRYGLWVDCSVANLDHVTIISAPSGLGDGDDYCVRGDTQAWHSSDCSFSNKSKGVLRIYNCQNFTSTRDTFNSATGRLMLGGGSSSEWDNAGVFKGTLTNDTIAVQSVQVYTASDVTFIGCNFTGTSQISVNGSGKLTLNNCTNVPTISQAAGSTVIRVP